MGSDPFTCQSRADTGGSIQPHRDGRNTAGQGTRTGTISQYKQPRGKTKAFIFWSTLQKKNILWGRTLAPDEHMNMKPAEDYLLWLPTIIRLANDCGSETDRVNPVHSATTAVTRLPMYWQASTTNFLQEQERSNTKRSEALNRTRLRTDVPVRLMLIFGSKMIWRSDVLKRWPGKKSKTQIWRWPQQIVTQRGAG